MFEWKSGKEWRRLFRYYQAGLINMAFGFGLFALFVRIGLNIYVAQILSHILGVTFNYFTYSRYAFAGHDGKRLRFILSYVANYFFNLVALAILMRFIKSPYLAGLITTVGVSAANYFVLKFLVFQEHPA
ncbi:GtrA family protein [Novosphingobium acidiphilum]|uniref:GtrA family protein n=1 Tax=Novosphingobium acidiphilum TaxID=505248 RepID=UPI000404E379|nr:GtrA family protein [Novosphingobium acidiphilum]